MMRQPAGTTWLNGAPIPMASLPSNLPAFLWYLVRPHWKALTFMLTGFVLGALINSALGPYYLKLVVDAADAVLNKHDPTGEGIVLPAAGYAALFLAAALTYRSVDVLRKRAMPAVRRQVILTTSDWIQAHSPRAFADGFAGSFSNKVFDLADGATAILARITWMFEGLAMLVLGTVTVFFIHPWLALVFLSWSTIFLAITAISLRRVYRRSQTYSSHRSGMVGSLVDTFSNSASVRLFARRRHESNRLCKIVDVNVDHDRAVQQSVIYMRIGHDASIILFMAGLLLVLIALLKRGQASPGDFALVLNLAISTFNVIWNLADEAVFFAEDWGKCGQALTLASQPHEIRDAEDARALRVGHGGIVFEEVCFGYQAGQLLFRGLQLEIAPGQKLGLVGASGSGKSSFVNLLLRSYDPTSGRILIDGQDGPDGLAASLRLAASDCRQR